jgi:hypothetical protein
VDRLRKRYYGHCSIITESGFLIPSLISDMTLSDCGLRGAPRRLGFRGILSRVGIIVMMRALTLNLKIVDSRGGCTRFRNCPRIHTEGQIRKFAEDSGFDKNYGNAQPGVLYWPSINAALTASCLRLGTPVKQTTTTHNEYHTMVTLSPSIR